MDASVARDRPRRIVGDLPRMAIGIDEDPGVPAPEGGATLTADPRPGGCRLLQDPVHLGRRPDVVRQGHAAPTTAIVDGAVLGERLTAPEGEDHAARLEEHHLTVGRLAPPAQGLVEGAGPAGVGHAQGDE